MTEKKNKISGRAVDFAILKRIFSYTKAHKKNFYFGLCTTITLACIAPLRPYLISFTFDNYVAKGNAPWLLYMTMVLVALLMVEAFLQFADSFITNRLGQNIVKDLRLQLYKHIISLRLKYYDNTPIGTLVTRAVSDIEVIADIFAEGLIVIIGDILKLTVILCVMLFTNYKLTIVSLLTIPLLLVATYLFKKAVADRKSVV